MAEPPKRRPRQKSLTRAGARKKKDLANDIVGLGDRLSTIEGGTTDLSRRLDQLIEVVLDRKSPSKTYGVDTNDSVPNKRETTASQATKPAIHSLPDLLATDAPNAMLERSADEQYHTFSTISLFRHARQLVLKHFAKKQNVPVDPFAPTSSPASGLSKTDMTGARNPTFVIDISRQDSLYPLPSPYLEKSVKIDQQPIKLPPRSILDDAQMFYFDNVLLEMPLFRRETFLGAIEVQYRLDPSQIDKAWAVCFDCVILQSLGTKSKLVLNGSNLRTLSNSDLQTSILETLKAIILNLNEFSQPCILNVQALLLLSLVARDYFHFSEFEKVFDRACQMAKSMRLQEHTPVNQSTSYHEDERENLILVLYVVDKQRVFVKGPPCQIHLFECHIFIPSHDDGRPGKEMELADLQLVCLLEEIYRHLYSAKAKRQHPASQQETSNSLVVELDSWWSRFKDLLKVSSTGSTRSGIAMRGQKLRYMFLVMQILVVRCGFGEESKRRSLEHARSALGIIQTLCTGTCLLNGALLVVERLLRNNSIVAYFEIFENLLNNPGPHQKTDLALLSTVTNALGLLSHPNRADSYLARLRKRLMWCTQIAVMICNERVPWKPRTQSPNMIDLDQPKSVDHAVFIQGLQSRDRPTPVPQNDSWCHVPGVDSNVFAEAECFDGHTGLVTMSPQRSSIALGDPTLDFSSSSRDSSTSLSSVNEYLFMDTSLTDSAFTSLCNQTPGSAGSFLPPATPLFFGDDVAFDGFYQNMMLQPPMDNLDEIDMQFSIP